MQDAAVILNIELENFLDIYSIKISIRKKCYSFNYVQAVQSVKILLKNWLHLSL